MKLKTALFIAGTILLTSCSTSPTDNSDDILSSSSQNSETSSSSKNLNISSSSEML